MKATLWRVLGALVGAAAGVPAGLGLREALTAGAGWALLAIGIAIVATTLLYLIAQPFRTAGAGSAEFMVGLLLGINTAINAVLLAALLGVVVAVIVCAIPLLAIVAPVARSDVYQAPLGWSNWLLPMSWPIVASGTVLLLLSLALAWIPVPFFRLKGFLLDVKTGTFVLAGGLGGNANLNPGSDGFNLGNFAFLRAPASEYLVSHEAGHTLNLAAWGWIIHLIGAVDENVLNHGVEAYTEWVAEGNVPLAQRLGTHPVFPLWGEPTRVTPTGP